jgi:hypothetical protein
MMMIMKRVRLNITIHVFLGTMPLFLDYNLERREFANFYCFISM